MDKRRVSIRDCWISNSETYLAIVVIKLLILMYLKTTNKGIFVFVAVNLITDS